MIHLTGGRTRVAVLVFFKNIFEKYAMPISYKFLNQFTSISAVEMTFSLHIDLSEEKQLLPRKFCSIKLFLDCNYRGINFGMGNSLIDKTVLYFL